MNIALGIFLRKPQNYSYIRWIRFAMKGPELALCGAQILTQKDFWFLPLRSSNYSIHHTPIARNKRQSQYHHRTLNYWWTYFVNSGHVLQRISMSSIETVAVKFNTPEVFCNIDFHLIRIQVQVHLPNINWYVPPQMIKQIAMSLPAVNTFWTEVANLTL